MKKKKYFLLVCLIFLISFVIAVTYSLWSWQGNNNMLVFNTADNLKKYINYDGGNSKFIGDFKASSSYNGGVYTTISISKTSSAKNIPLYASINMKINNIEMNSLNNPAIKWAVTSGEYNASNPQILSQGNFLGLNKNDDIVLYNNVEITTQNQFFTIWVWLDSSIPSSNDVTGEVIDLSVWTEVNQIAYDFFEITQLFVGHNKIFATAVNTNSDIAYYAFTSNENTPTSWVNIPVNKRSKHYNLETEFVSNSKYLWFKDVNNRTTYKKINVKEPYGVSNLALTSDGRFVVSLSDYGDDLFGLKNTYGYAISTSSTCAGASYINSSDLTYSFSQNFIDKETYYGCIKLTNNVGNVKYLVSSGIKYAAGITYEILSSNYRCGSTAVGNSPYLMNYSGNCQIINAGNGYFRVNYTSNGSLTFNKDIGVDLFLVGGGEGGGDGSHYGDEGWGNPNDPLYYVTSGPGGDGGKIYTVYNVSLLKNSSYSISIGTGGVGIGGGSEGKRHGSPGTASSISGNLTSYNNTYNSFSSSSGSVVATNGANGQLPFGNCGSVKYGASGGKGGASIYKKWYGTYQSKTEAESGGKTGAGDGGAGPSDTVGGDAWDNSGGGGGGSAGASKGGTGGSGIVILRNIETFSALSTVTLEYDNMGGSGCSPHSVTPGLPYGNLCEPVRDSYVFKGWYDDATEGNKINSNTIVNSNVKHKLYARWVDVSAPDILFSNDGNSGYVSGNVSSTINVVKGNSELDASSFKYIYSTNKNAIPNISFSNGQKVYLNNGTGQYYLIAKACSVNGVCFTKKSLVFYVDNVAPNGTVSSETHGHNITINVSASDSDSGINQYGFLIQSTSSCPYSGYTMTTNKSYTFNKNPGTYYACVKILDNVGYEKTLGPIEVKSNNTYTCYASLSCPNGGTLFNDGVCYDRIGPSIDDNGDPFCPGGWFYSPSDDKCLYSHGSGSCSRGTKKGNRCYLYNQETAVSNWNCSID